MQVMQKSILKGCRDHQSSGNAGSHTPLRGNSAEIWCSRIHRVFKGKKQFNDIRWAFWCRGEYIDTVGRSEKVRKEYVRNQLQEDIEAD